ncbi:GGDEF domain-containing protein, partial [Micrococcus sp. SIMBA_131]
DGFKQVNDTWGHGAGDTLLRDIATGLSALLVPPESLARLGGDEFVVAATVADQAEAEALAERVRRFFDRPLAVLPGRSHAMT